MADPWRVARSLNVLLDQFNTLAPTRNKASDGSIGDADHQNRTSDHNPWYGPGIVTARDFTHDSAKLNMQWVADTLAAHRDPRIKYVIWNRRIMSGAGGPSPWVWRAYSGTNPHTSHLHLSVVASPACDSTAAWAGFIPQPPEVPEMELDDSMRGGPTPLAFPAGPPPEADTVRRTLASSFSYSRDASQRTARLETKLDTVVGALTKVVAATSNDPDITREEIAQIVRDNSAHPDVIRTTIVETLAASNAELADDVVDQLVSRLAN